MQQCDRKWRAEDEASAAEDESTNAKDESDASRTPRPRPCLHPCGKKARNQTKDSEGAEVD